MSWQDAVEFCAKDGRTLRQERFGLDEQQSDRSWTRIYEMERFVTLIETKSSNDNCVQLECNNVTTKLWSVKCKEKADLLCNNTLIPGNFTWRVAAEECKKNYGLLRDLNIKTICKTGLRRTWFGFGSVDSEESYNNYKSPEVMHLQPKLCLSCDSEKCKLEDCRKPRLAICEPKSRNTSQETTHIISGKSNNTLLQWTTSTNVKVSKRTTGNYSKGGLFTTETVISSNKSPEDVYLLLLSLHFKPI
ncbi:uncharacterized protein LOC111122312 [Crassostrea virginica]